MLDSERLAIAAHMHVLLRRKTGRVTDTEWMASNVEYAAEVARFARARAAEDGLAELAQWADKLEHAVRAAPSVNRPLARRGLEALRAKAVPPDAAQSMPPATGPKEPSSAPDPLSPRYVGGIR